MGKFVAMSKRTKLKYLIDTDHDDLQRELYNLMRQSEEFDLREFIPDAENEKIWAIYLKEVIKR